MRGPGAAVATEVAAADDTHARSALHQEGLEAQCSRPRQGWTSGQKAPWGMCEQHESGGGQATATTDARPGWPGGGQRCNTRLGVSPTRRDSIARPSGEPTTSTRRAEQAWRLRSP